MKNPYIGPRPFAAGDHKRFFGREREIEEITSHLYASRVLVLYAESGAGKTSLLNAGVLPDLAGDFNILPVSRVSGAVEQGIDRSAIRNLAVHHALSAWSRKYAQIDPASMSLAEAVAETGASSNARPALIVFDQFEELFTGFADRAQDRSGFFDQLGDCLHVNPTIKVMLSLREDFLGEFNAYADRLFIDYRHRRYRLERLREKAARRAVVEPLPHGDPPRRFDEGVVDHLVRELLQVRLAGASQPLVGEFVEPVQLQVVCETLWNNLSPDITVITKKHAQEFGDVTEALTAFYTSALEKASRGFRRREGKIRDFFDNHLITEAGTRGTVVEGDTTTGGLPNDVIGTLEDAHVVRAEESRGARWYELTHDRLIEPVRAANSAWRARRRRRLAVAGGVLATAAVITASVFTTAAVQGNASPVDDAAAISYRGADLRDEDFSGQDLSGEDFTGADLTRTNFSGATLIDAIFTGANLTDANLTDVVAIRTDFGDTNLRGATFSGADLTSASLRSALGEALIEGTAIGKPSGVFLVAAIRLDSGWLGWLWPRMSALQIDETLDCTASDVSPTDFRNAVLRDADVTNAQLAWAQLGDGQLEGADLTGADLRCAGLSGAALPNATLIGVNLAGADLSNSVLAAANLTDATLPGAMAIGADFSDATMLRSQFGGANLSGATFVGADLAETSLAAADLSNANFERVDLARIGQSDLSGLDLSGARLVGANLERLDMAGVRLSGADLSEANLGATNLTGAGVENAVLGRAVLAGAVLHGASLDGADLRAADLTGADLVGARVTDTACSGTSFALADLTGLDLTTVRDENLSGSDFTGATLAGATLDGMALGGLRFDGADLTVARLVDAQLVAATLTAAKLDEAVLTGASLVGADLSGATIASAIAAGTDFSGANLTDVEAGGAEMTDARFAGAVLTGAEFAGADLSRANLGSVDLTRVGLRGVRLSDANLAGSGLAGADISGGTLARANLAEARLAGTNLIGADLSTANLAKADAANARLSNANLSDAILIAATLDGADLSTADLQGAVLTLASMQGASLREANLSRANLAQVNLTGADADGADLGRANLTGATVVAFSAAGVNLSAANLTGADFTDANLSGADLRNGVRFDACETQPDLVMLATRTTETMFSGANLSGALLDGVDLSRSTGLGRYRDENTGLVLGPIPANLTGVTAAGASFPDQMRDAQLRDAELECANFTDSDLTFSDLTGADLTNATLARVVMLDRETGTTGSWVVPDPRTLLDGATFHEADLSGADIRAAVFDSVDLSAANLEGALLRESSFIGSDLSEANFTAAILGFQSISEIDSPFGPALLSNADLSHANFEGADLNRVDFGGADLSHAVFSNAIVDFADLSTANIQYTLLDVLSDSQTAYPTGFARPAIVGNATFESPAIQVDTNNGSLWTSDGSEFSTFDPFSIVKTGGIRPVEEIAITDFVVGDAAVWAVTTADIDGLSATPEKDVFVSRITPDGSVATVPLSSCVICWTLTIDLIDEVAWITGSGDQISSASFDGTEIFTKTMDIAGGANGVTVAAGYVWVPTSIPESSQLGVARVDWTGGEVVYLPIDDRSLATAESVVALGQYLWIVTEVAFEDPNSSRVETTGALYRIAIDDAAGWDGSGTPPAADLVLNAAHGGDIIAAEGHLWISQQGQRAIVGVDPEFLAVTHRLCTAPGRLRLICGDAERDFLTLRDLAFDPISLTLWAATPSAENGSLTRIQLLLETVGEPPIAIP